MLAYILLPNGRRFNRLAGCAGLGSSILRFRRRTYQRRLRPKANSAATSGWAANIFSEHLAAINVIYKYKSIAYSSILFVQVHPSLASERIQSMASTSLL